MADPSVDEGKPAAIAILTASIERDPIAADAALDVALEHPGSTILALIALATGLLVEGSPGTTEDEQRRNAIDALRQWAQEPPA